MSEFFFKLKFPVFFRWLILGQITTPGKGSWQILNNSNKIIRRRGRPGQYAGLCIPACQE